jgi:integrase
VSRTNLGFRAEAGREDPGTSVVVDIQVTPLPLTLTGLRFGELAALKVRRVLLDQRRLVVAESVTEIGGQLAWSTPKNHQTRSVPLLTSLVEGLSADCEGKEPDDLVFTAPQGGVLRINNWRPRIFDPACEAAELTGITPRDLRHTAASLAIAAGANLKAVQRMLGHASASMTLDLYAGLFGDDLDDVAARLDLLVTEARSASAEHDTTKDD